MQQTMKFALVLGLVAGANAATLRNGPNHDGTMTQKHKLYAAAKADQLMHLMAGGSSQPAVHINDMVTEMCKTHCSKHCPGFPNCPGGKAPGGAPAPAPGPGAPAAPAAPAPVRYLGVGDPETYRHLLPYHPDGQPEFMFKSRCINFLNQVLEKADYDPALVMKLLPKCHWKKAECDELHADLATRMGAPPGPAPSPAPAAFLELGASGPAPAPGPEVGMGEHIYGWCDTMYTMSKDKAYHEVSKEQKEEDA
eukprot:gnl/TRDRNA2_/TRDRNA2_178795_c0_seq1.p1 gnl/TRDRNA2_/TRDRNA2_178795_c0~~gnl/TRDRNA2_/TRDRNA2_178795_c0_seq1.p1  ORF type:complete len:252 (+),score=61.14 gnl/TRDRNA2_/TRDRNA2_178795_c0_seq1:84-839(+)